MNSGLMLVVAFLEQKGGRHLRPRLHRSHNTRENLDGFMNETMETDNGEFQEATTEALCLVARQGGGQ